MINWFTNRTNIFGLTNTGSICYFNSLLQALFGCPAFVKHIRQERIQEFTDIINESISNANIGLLHEVNKKFNNYYQGQQCCHEFFISMIDYLSNTPLNKEKIDTIFSIKCTSKIYCKKCNVLAKSENDKMYSIQVPQDYTGSLQEIISNKYTKLSTFTCEKNHKNCSYMINVLNQLPYVLVIVFSKYDKKNNFIYDQTIEIETIEKKYKYKLVSVIDHYGTQQSGHYMCRSLRNNKVMLFDDTKVIPDSNLNPTEAAYMLFYHIV